MRRSDREIKEMDEIVRIMEQCEICRLALNDAGYPYIVPLSFGMSYEDNRITLYFHGADQGKKQELIHRDDRAGFEMDCACRLITGKEACGCSMEYASVIGRGRIEPVPDAEKEQALGALMKQYHLEALPFRQAAVHKTAVIKLVVESVTGKAHRQKE